MPAIDQPETPPEKRPRLDLSPVQVVGGALAAMTAAGLGSRFSVEGTIVGAALASVIAAVAGALYTASLRRTSAAVRGVLGSRRSGGPGTKAAPEAEPVAPHGSTAAPLGLAATGNPARRSRRRSIVLSSVVGALAIFGIAGGALTAYEAIAGSALSGGDGTTISQVQPGGSDDRRTPEPSSTPSESADPSESAPTPTSEPSDSAEADPAPSVEPSAEPTVEPSAEPSATSEAEPSASAEAPSSAPSQGAETPR